MSSRPVSAGRAPGPRTRLPTIRDVATRAGVSAATVSRTLNNFPVVAPPTRARVERAVDELSYRRSSAARNLSLGRTNAIGVVAPFFTTPSVVERLRGVVERLAGRNYDLLLFDVESPRQRDEAVHDFARRGRVDGLLVISLPLSEPVIEALRRDGVPLVLVDLPHATLPHLAIDNVLGGELATEHLLARGARRIGFVGDSPAGAFDFTSSEHRRRGYERALRRAGIEALPELQVRGPHGRESARALAERLLARAGPPAAVFAASDIQAVGVLEAARALHLRVPDDLAVIGFDDIELAAIVGLTTVRQPLYASGAAGVDLLLAQIETHDSGPEARELAPLAVIERRTA